MSLDPVGGPERGEPTRRTRLGRIPSEETRRTSGLNRSLGSTVRLIPSWRDGPWGQWCLDPLSLVRSRVRVSDGLVVYLLTHRRRGRVDAQTLGPRRTHRGILKPGVRLKSRRPLTTPDR